MKTIRKWLIDKVYRFLLPGLGTSGQKFAGKLKQGVTITLYNIPSTIALLALAALLQILPYVLAFMAAYGLTRSFAYGIHLKNCYLCAAWGFLYFIGGSLLATQIQFTMVIKIVIYCICCILLALYAPGNNEYQPYSPKRKSLLRLQTLIVTGILFIVSIYCEYIGLTVYSNVIMLATIAQTVNVLPITYILFGEKREFEYKSVVAPDEETEIKNIEKPVRKAVCRFQVYGVQLMFAVVVLSQLRTGQPFWHNAPHMGEDYYNTLENATWTNFGRSIMKGFCCKK